MTQSVMQNKTVSLPVDHTGVATAPHQKRERTHWKGDTDDKNDAFEDTLKQRETASPKNVWHENKEMIKTLSHGRPPKERMAIPEGVEVFMYGNQKLNIWEFQKEQLRK